MIFFQETFQFIFLSFLTKEHRMIVLQEKIIMKELFTYIS